MAKLRQNIWFLFALLFLGSCVLLVFFLHQRWQLVVQEHSQQQHTQVQQLASSVQSLLSVQQVLADLYHDQLVQLVKAEQLDIEQGTRLLDHLMQNNRYATAYAISRLDGELLWVSSNRTIAALGNLKDLNESLFNQALQANQLTLGPTYYIPSMDAWTIPVRQALRLSEHEPLAMMALGISLKEELNSFIAPLLLPKMNSVALIRQQDGYYQFFAGEASSSAERYETPVALTVLQQLQARLKANTGLSLQQLRQSEEAYNIRLTLPEGQIQTVIRYLPEYQLWAVSKLHSRVMQQVFWHNSWRYLGVFLLSQLLLFFLVRTIAHADRSRRAELMFEATHDQLTGLPNRNYLRQHNSKLLGSAESGCYLLFLDLDNFKTINDSFGHELGDVVLKEVTRRLKVQAGHSGSIVRHGGDEFLIFLPAASEQAAMQLASQLVQQLSSPYQVEKLRFVLGASIGIAHYPSHASQLDDLVRAADIAMYEAKKTKNNISLYSKPLDARYQRRFAIEQRLRTAIEQQHLFMVYQPQIDSRGQLHGVEALVRWQDPVDGFIPPDQFVPVAEDSGQMPLLGQFIMQQAFADISRIQQQLGQRFQLSLNISVRQLLQSDFLTQLSQHIQQFSLAAEQLTLELTESILIEDHDHVCQLLGSIKQLGCKVSMDDFGTGYSSLSMLRSLPVDELKIDKSFIDCMRDDETCRNMTASIIAIGQRMKLLTIAEGVEHSHERDLLLQMGCELYQGYFFAKPMPAEQLRSYLQQMKADQPIEGANFNPGQ
ncbi:EAL domain-containing protein [Alkalimonas sp.]|uniref:putative bifunctional diguanylate cyclase/phosphodiesterase n=1 Tax=Alkalimonas sp. TaxID=1872453 RepID=UPI00263A6AE1|nr:EAL domain-containing protein [Alkalimonas sp.]MCC5825617.1 EAL domain-containing protein [Alkalimonas sp.]